MHKETIIDSITIMRDGTMTAMIGKLIVDDDGTLMAEPLWHVMTVQPDADLGAVIEANSAHLVQMGWPAIPLTEIDRLNTQAAIVRTPEVVAAFEAKKTLIFAKFAKTTYTAENNTLLGVEKP
jgi:hypothetical protein